MKKTLIALTLAALPVASMADVILYGDIKGGVEVSKKRGVKGTVTNLVDYGSYIGFKGEEQLNGNLKAIWQVEQKIDIAGGQSEADAKIEATVDTDVPVVGVAKTKQGRGFGTRNTFVGLTGDFGTVKAGYQGTPNHALSGKLDVWSASDSAASLGQFTRDTDASRRAVAVTYETPNFNGLTAKVFVSPSDNNTTGVVNKGSANESAKTPDSATYGTSVSYAQPNGGFFADVAGTYVRRGAAAAVHGRTSGYQALAQFGYAVDRFTVGGAYQRTHNVDALAARSNEAILTTTFNVDPALRLKASGAYGWGFKNSRGYNINGNGKYYQGILGADYALSKRTTTNAQVGYIKTGNRSNRDAFGAVSVGMSHKF